MSWKVTAWIFIILFIVETLFVIYLFKLGNESIEKETLCQNICIVKDSSFFDYDDGVCECFDENGKGFYKEAIR